MEFRQTKKIVIVRNVMVSNEGKKIKILLECSSTMPYSPRETGKNYVTGGKRSRPLNVKKTRGKVHIVENTAKRVTRRKRGKYVSLFCSAFDWLYERSSRV